MFHKWLNSDSTYSHPYGLYGHRALTNRPDPELVFYLISPNLVLEGADEHFTENGINWIRKLSTEKMNRQIQNILNEKNGEIVEFMILVL